MPAESEALLVDYLRRQSVVTSISNVRSEEIGLRQYRFQARDCLCFDCGELGVA